MESLEDRIALATRHVAVGRRILERQRELVAKGTVGPDAMELLKLFEKMQAIFEGDLDRFLQERDKK